MLQRLAFDLLHAGSPSWRMTDITPNATAPGHGLYGMRRSLGMTLMISDHRSHHGKAYHTDAESSMPYMEWCICGVMRAAATSAASLRICDAQALC